MEKCRSGDLKYSDITMGTFKQDFITFELRRLPYDCDCDELEEYIQNGDIFSIEGDCRVDEMYQELKSRKKLKK